MSQDPLHATCDLRPNVAFMSTRFDLELSGTIWPKTRCRKPYTMPELPEVEHAARGLGAQIVGRQIVAVTRLDWERMVETPAVEQFIALLEGREVLAAGRRAKWILLTLDA